MIFGVSWCFLVVLCSSLWFLLVLGDFCGSWWFLVVLGWFFMVHGNLGGFFGSLWLLVILDSFLEFLGRFLVVICGS